MAEVTTQVAFLARAGAVLTMTYEDVIQPKPPALRLPQALTRFNLTCTGPVEIKLWRQSQTPWREFVLPPGSYEYPAGGPVQDVGDISYIYLTTA